MTIATAVVTGAASGVGRECTRMLLEGGCRVVGMDVNTDAMRGEFADAGDMFSPFGVDIGDYGQCMVSAARVAKALGPKGVRVNAVSPGVIETAMTKSWPQAVKQATVGQTPLGRLALPDDIAAVACFLASEDARFVTGEIVEVNGGFYFR